MTEANGNAPARSHLDVHEDEQEALKFIGKSADLISRRNAIHRPCSTFLHSLGQKRSADKAYSCDRPSIPAISAVSNALGGHVRTNAAS